VGALTALIVRLAAHVEEIPRCNLGSVAELFWV
jgi:hypothetical protein